MMHVLDVLLAEYPGDKAWRRLVDVVVPANAAEHDLGIDDHELAAVLNAELGAQAAPWLEQNIPALGGQSAAAILQDHPHGRSIVRAVVMRMPR
jgi:hypothetical protein